MNLIRNFKKEDFNEIVSWWEKAGEPGPILEMIPEESSFVLLEDDKLSYAISVYLTNCKEVCYLENFIRNPKTKNSHFSQVLVDYACNFAKTNGFKRVLCLSYRDKLKEHYQTFGMTKTMDNISSFVREV